MRERYIWLAVGAVWAFMLYRMLSGKDAPQS